MSATAVPQPLIPVARKGRLRRPRGLVLVCLGAAVVVVLPVMITVVQAFQGEWSAAKTALSASATPTLFLHTIELAVLVTPVSGVLGVAAAWLVERTRRAGPADMAAAAGGAVGRPAVRHQLCLGDAELVADRVLGRGRDRHVLLLPDRVPARGGVAARDGSGARGDCALAGPGRVAHLLRGWCCRSCARRSWAACCWSCSTRSSSSTRSWR